MLEVKSPERRKMEIALLAVLVAVSRFLFRSHVVYDIDSVNFVLGVSRFSPRVYQPHPPGYFLYICLGRLLNFFVHDANLALILLSLLTSIGVVVLIYLLAEQWFSGESKHAALFAGLLFVFSPLAWFHGTVALTYSVEAFFSALLGWLCWRMPRAGSVYVAGTAIVLGISAGIRPSSLLFLGPLFLFALLSVSPRRRVIGIAVLAATLLAWFLPMLAASGGADAYFGALFSLWKMVPSRDTVFNSSPVTSVARAITIAFIYVLEFGVAALLPLFLLADSRKGEPVAARKKIFTAVWMLPALCFFTLIFLKFVNSGYLLLLMAPACLWMGRWLAGWYESAAMAKPIKIAILFACGAVNVWMYLAMPVYCSYASVRRFQAEMEDVRTSLPKVGAPDELLIVGVDNHFLGFRHCGYYLPQYLTIEYPEVRLIEGTRLFAMQGGQTELLTALPTGGYKRFVLCPLPKDNLSYTQYLESVSKVLPQKDLQREKIGGHEYISAPISDLDLLYSSNPPTPQASVNQPRHSAKADVYSRRQ